MEMLPQQFRVPEIYGAYWFNSDPIALGALRGYVMLIEFWDYASQSCIQSLPYTVEWHKRYAETGLVTIGIHTPQFPFASDPINVRTAIEKLKIRYPVMMDNDFLAWGAFRSTVWPTKYLVDKNGFIRFVHAGAGSYQNFEHAIQSLLNESGYHADFPVILDPLRETDRLGAICYRATTEILTGWRRGTIGNVEGYSPESTIHYEDPGIYIDGRLYLHGNWLNDRDYLRLDETDGKEGRLILTYEAKEVNAVIKPEGEKKFQVFIQQDDAYLTDETKGDDVRIDEQGRSFFLVREAKLYSLVKNTEFGAHKLAMSMRSNGFALYAISFVSSVIPEMASNR
jgi:hypothetical protein